MTIQQIYVHRVRPNNKHEKVYEELYKNIYNARQTDLNSNIFVVL